MATLAKSRQVFDAVVFLQVWRVFAVVDFQIVGAVANAAAPAVSDNRLFPPRLPFGRLNVSLVGVQTGNGIVLFHAPHYIPFSAVPVHFFLSFPSSAWECVPRSSASPLSRHSGIFIPPALHSGIANLRWRNENVRNLRRQAVGGFRRSHNPLAREIPDIFIPRDCIRCGYLTPRPRGMKIPE